MSQWHTSEQKWSGGERNPGLESERGFFSAWLPPSAHNFSLFMTCYGFFNYIFSSVKAFNDLLHIMNLGLVSTPDQFCVSVFCVHLFIYLILLTNVNNEFLALIFWGWNEKLEQLSGQLQNIFSVSWLSINWLISSARCRERVTLSAETSAWLSVTRQRLTLYLQKLKRDINSGAESYFLKTD